MNPAMTAVPQNSDSSDLPGRITYCAQLVGNQSKLARAVGVSKPAIAKYLAGLNRPRPEILFKIAQVAGVSFEWLERGEGAPTRTAPSGSSSIQTVHELVRQLGGIEKAIELLSLTLASKETTKATYESNGESSGLMPPDITARLCRLIKEWGGVEVIAKGTGLTVGRLNSLCEGAAPTMGELQALVANRVLSLDWLIAGEQVQNELAWSSQVLVQLEKTMRNFDANRRPMTAFGGPGGVAVDPTPYIHVEGIARFWAEIYNVLPPSRYSCERMQTDSLDPVIREGDIVLFDLNQKAVASGICLIETIEKKVVVRVQNRGGKLMASYPAHRSSDFEIDQNAIVGVAVWAFRKITLRDA